MMRTANPALNKNTFVDVAGTAPIEGSMTVQGTVNKTGFLLIFLLIPAVWVWNRFFSALPDTAAASAAVMPFLWGGILGGIVFAFITIFNKKARLWLQ